MTNGNTKPLAAGKALRALGSVAILTWLAWRTDWRQVADTFANLRLHYWLFAVALYAATQVVSSQRWQILARPLGFERPLGHYVRFYFIGMFFNLFLPTSVGGDVVRAWYLDSGSGRRMAAFLSVFVDRLSGLLVLLAMACIAVSVCPLELPWWLPAGVWGSAGAAALGLTLLPLAAKFSAGSAVRTGPVAGYGPVRTANPTWYSLLQRLGDFGRRLSQALGLVLRPAPFVLSLIVQAANVVLVWLIGLAVGAPVPASYYWVLVPMVTLLTLAPVSLNGMGVREGGTVLLLAPLGVGTGTALSLAFLWFAAFTVPSLGGVAFYLFGRFPRFEVRPDDDLVGSGPHQGRARQPAAAA